jgi:AraC-like DNA-binding protein
LLKHYKMNAAAKLLLEGNLLVKEVAAEIGFDDPLHFSQSFKSFFGIAPRNFAQRCRLSETVFPAEYAGSEFQGVASSRAWPQAAGG